MVPVNSSAALSDANSSDDVLKKIKLLRKSNIQKARKLQRRLNKKKGKKGVFKEQQIQEKTPPSGSLLSAAEETEDGADMSAEDAEEYVVRSFEEELIGLCSEGVVVGKPQDFLEVKQAVDRFLVVDETRAAGKGGGGGMEDFGLEGQEEMEDIEDRAQAHRLGLDGDGMKDDSGDEDDDEDAAALQKAKRHGLSKKKLKQLRRPTVSQLKQVCARPEVVESWDTTAPDPQLLVYVKAHRNTVPVPAHWSHKRRYLQGKRGLEKSQFNLPHYIEATRISEIRKAIEDKDSKKTLKQRMREKVRPRHRKMNIDYQTLHDAFFKYATKPPLTKFGDVYFEGKETEMLFRRYTPGKLSARCRDALGMTGALDAPPWLINMQRYGPPPSYPNLVVSGVNAHLPEGAALGFQPGGWGKPPGLDQLKLWGVTPRFEEVVIGEDQFEGLDGGDGGLWGVLQTVDSEDEAVEEEEPEEEPEVPDAALLGIETPSHHMGIPGHMTPVALDPSGMASVTSLSTGFITPGLHAAVTGGMESVSSALETPQSVDLRRSGFASDHLPKPYTVLERTKAPAQPGALFASESIYGIPTSLDSASTKDGNRQSDDGPKTSNSLGGTATPLGSIA